VIGIWQHGSTDPRRPFGVFPCPQEVTHCPLVQFHNPVDRLECHALRSKMTKPFLLNTPIRQSRERRFVRDTLVEAPQGHSFAHYRVTNSPLPPENQYLLNGKPARLNDAATMHLALVADVFNTLVSAKTRLASNGKVSYIPLGRKQI
jgi:hypothetical protein